MAGHKFRHDPISKDDSFADIEKKLAEQLKGDLGGNNGNNGNKGNQPQPPGDGWGGPGGQGGQQIPGYYDIDKRKPNQQPS